MGRAGSVVQSAVLLCGLGLAAPARAQPCTGLVDAGPLLAGPGGTDFGQVPEACGSSDLFLRLRGELLANSDDFYGVVTAGGTLRGRWQLTPHWTVSAAFDPATFRYPINAVITSTGVTVGPATVGVYRDFTWRRTALAAYSRLLLPLESGRHYGARFGGEVGASTSYRLCDCGSLRAGIALPATLVAIGGVGHGIFAPGALVEGVYSPRPWVAFSGGMAVRVQAAPHGDLSALAARASARLENRCGWHLALAGDVPVAGVDRTDFTVSIFVGRGLPREEQ
jgi:hypothetical protein